MRVYGAQLVRRQRLAQDAPLRLRIARAGETLIERRELVELGLRREIGMVGDIVGFARETIEGDDDRAKAGRDEARSDGEIFLVLRLARQRGLRVHRFLSACVRLNAALPQSAAPAPIEVGGFEREGQIGRRDQRQGEAP